MKFRYLTNLILILLVAGLYWYNNQNEPNDDVAKLTSITRDEIQIITISRPTTDDIVLRKSSSGWQVTHPIKSRANGTRIDLLLSLLNTRSHAQLIVNDTHDNALSQYGLSPAKVTLKLNDHVFKIGHNETINNYRYILHNDVIHLIDDDVAPLLHVNATGFIDNRLIPPNHTIRKLELPVRNANNDLSADPVIIENKEGHWISMSLDQTSDQLTTLIELWQYAYATRVLTFNMTDQSTAKTAKIRIWYQDIKQASEFDVEFTENTLFITDQQQLKYQFPASLFQQLIPASNITP
ncbi:MAG: DUF4340 domain-containing protein [Gammaproteobacteria bacterium]|nr:DUF4340 domain-containing protein [Gammaproteobacteria bacterium]MDH5592404.1 DUF4340 domain-containing protein [Gammaproteobacteria bacterium]